MTPATTRMQERFVEELKTLLNAGRGSEAITLFYRGTVLSIYPEDESLEEWVSAALGREATRHLVTLFAVSPCAFCRRGLESCVDCDRHGHYNYTEICEACLGLGVCRCDFCNGSGLTTIEAVPIGLRIPVALERAHCALGQIDRLVSELSVEPEVANPRDSLKEQTAYILRLNGLLGMLENELDTDDEIPWWIPYSTQKVSEILNRWPELSRRAEEKLCAAFQSMSRTATRMASDAVEGSNSRELAQARAAFFARFTTPESLDRTDVDHPILDRIARELGIDAAETV